MEPIHVLRDEPECIGPAAFKFYKGKVGRIRLFRGNQFTSPVVPFPDQPRVSLKRLRGCEILRTVAVPQTLRSAKSRYAAVGRYACTG